MILSHRHRFIFLKTTKTGGTSLEIALSSLCGPDDVITPMAEEDERVRNKLRYPGPQNYKFGFAEYSWRDWRNALDMRKRKRFFSHIPAWRVRRLVGEKVWGQYYKFCYERNPWDRVMSLYFWLYRNRPAPELPQFVASNALEELKAGGSGVYSIDGEIAVDRVCRFERLGEDFAEVCSQTLGFDEVPSLPHAKAGFRTDRRPYSELLGPRERDRIASVFTREIEWFGYEF